MFAELVKSFHTRVVAAVRPGTCPALVNGTRRCLVTERKIRVFRTRGELICSATIAARTILIGPLYGQLLMENKNPAWEVVFEIFFMVIFFLTFSILLQSLVPSRI